MNLSFLCRSRKSYSLVIKHSTHICQTVMLKKHHRSSIPQMNIYDRPWQTRPYTCRDEERGLQRWSRSAYIHHSMRARRRCARSLSLTDLLKCENEIANVYVRHQRQLTRLEIIPSSNRSLAVACVCV